MLKSDNNFTKDQTIVNSSNYITTNKELSIKYKEHNIGIENMEYYALMQVANKFSIPIAGIFIVTNYTNKDAHKDFINNHQVSMNKLVSYLKSKNIIQNV
jgi:nucleoside phosphorylase